MVNKGRKRNSRLHRMDQKGRVAIPFSIRRDLRYGELLYLTKGLDPCIYVYTEEEWKKLIARFEEASLGKTSVRKKIRKIMGEVEEVEIDPQGRIRIPSHLAQYAGLEDQCFFARMPRWFEIWNPEKYREYMEESKDEEEIEEFPL